MDWYAVPITAPLLLVAVLLLVLTYNVWHYRRTPNARTLGWLAAAVTWWVLSFALERSAGDEGAKLWWAKMQYVGIVSTPVLWNMFCARYAARSSWFTQRRIVIAMIIPAITVLLVWTNDLHRLIWQRVGFVAVDGHMVLALDYGAWFWIHATYSYLMMLIGSVLLVRMASQVRGSYSTQAVLLVVSALLPWLGNAFYVLRIGAPATLDLTALAFGLSTLLLGVLLLRYQFLALVPFAHDAITSAIRDAVFVLDQQNYIIDLNATAEHLIGRRAASVRSHPLFHHLHTSPLLEQYCIHRDDVYIDVTGSLGGHTRIYETHIAPLVDYRRRMMGRMVILRDVTERKHAEQALHLLARAGQLLNVSLEYEATLATASRIAVPDVADWCIIRTADAAPSTRHAAITCADPAQRNLVALLEEFEYQDVSADHSYNCVLTTGQFEVIDAVSDQWLRSFARNAEHETQLRSIGLRSVMILPLIARGRTIGTMLLGINSSRSGFEQAGLVLGEGLAARARAGHR